MIVDFIEIPKWCKLWVFPSSRKFYPQEISELKTSIETFLNEWSSNEEGFNCAFQLKYDRFIIISVDDSEKKLSLKAHDKLSAFILSLEAKYEILLLDKINVCYKQGEFVQYKELKDFKKLLKNKAITAKSIIFDNLITTKIDFENNWEIPIEESWYRRFL